MRRAIAIVATLDTKAREAAELARLIRAAGHDVRVVDVGLRGTGDADVSAAEIAAAADTTLARLREDSRRDEAMRALGKGAGRVLAGWHGAGELGGAIGIGGNQGTAIAALALRALPLGIPKLIVSTVASGDVRSYVGDADVAMLFSVGDLLGGPNVVTAPVLANAAAAVCGMVRARVHVGEAPSRTVALTAFGNTHAAVERALIRLRERGCQVVPFHASGAGGSAMERLVDEGAIGGVLDLTTHELLAELYPEDIYAPIRPGRLTAAGRRGIPQVVAPGGLDYLCFGPAETVPERLRGRPTHHHNPYNLNVRATAEELGRVGGELAARLNGARGPCAVLIPLRGWSEVGSPGGVLHDPEANSALIDALRGRLRREIPLLELEMTINEPAFAQKAADTLADLLDDSGGVQPHDLGTASVEDKTLREEGSYAWR
jgi:uncharacterized protein (UPF0261 family)